MKKLAIICSVIIITAMAAAAWQFHGYNREVRQAIMEENNSLSQAMAKTSVLVAGRLQTITELEFRLKSLTNHPAGDNKSGNS